MNGRRKWKILLLVAIAMSGFGGRGGAVPALAGDDSLRIRTDTVRGRTWVLGLDDVRVFDTARKKLMRQIELPNWSVARTICAPDMVLDDSGSAIISSNVQARVWRVDADSFEVKEHEISLLGRERWDIGFGALTFAADGTLYALTSAAGSLWKIDIAKASAGMIEPANPPSTACAFSTQFLKDFERS
jgi:hypothetical protein